VGGRQEELILDYYICISYLSNYFMNRSLVVIILFCIMAQISEAQLWKQKRFEALASVGTSQFFGDIGGFSNKANILGFKDFSFLQTRFNLNAGLKYKIMKDLNVRLNMTYGMLHATDKHGANESRGLESSTTIFEPAVIGEYYFIKSKLGDSYSFNAGKGATMKDLFSALEFYAFTGFGGLSYNVKGNDKLVALGMKSSGFTAVIPIGAGMNLLFRPEYNLGLEIGGRYTFSDYLDGFTSQQSSSNDVYYFLNVTFTYKIKTSDNGLPYFLRKNRF
jgi:hypothetical protein